MLKVTQLIRTWSRVHVLCPGGATCEGFHHQVEMYTVNPFEICGHVLRTESRDLAPFWPNSYEIKCVTCISLLSRVVSFREVSLRKVVPGVV